MKQIMMQCILEYLKGEGLIQSYLQLEQQSKINLRQYAKEIDFFRKILLKGDFSEAVQFIWTFQHKIDSQTLNKLTLQILKQKLYELLENPQELQLRNLFEKQIIDVCSEQEYQHLFTLLTCRSVKQIQGMNQWSPIKGRFSCFEAIVPHLENIFVSGFPKSNKSSKHLTFNLENVVSRYLNSEGDQEEKKTNGNNLQNSQHNRNSMIREQPKHAIDSYQKNSHLHETQIHPNKSIGNKMMLSESKIQKSQGFFQRSYQEQKNSSGISRKINTIVGGSESNESNLAKSKQIQSSRYSKRYENEPLHAQQIEQEEDHINNLSYGKKSHIPSYIKQFPKQKQHNQSSMLQEQVRKNIAYLDQNNESEVYHEHQNFTFSHGAEQSAYNARQKKIFKLASISDPKAIRTAQFSSTGLYFAIGTNSSFLKIFDVEQLFQKNQPKQLLPIYQIPQLHSKSIFSLDWSSNEKSIVTCSNDLTIRVTDFVADTYKFGSHRTNIIGRHQSCIRMVKFNSLQTKIVSCGDDCLIKVWDIGKVKKCLSLKGHENGVSAFRFGQNQGDNIIYSVGKDSIIRKWDIRVGEMVAHSHPQDSEMTYIANNTDRIVVSHKNGYVSFFDESLELQNTAKIHDQQIRSIDGTSYDDLLLTSSFDGHISIFTQATSDLPNYHQHNDVEDDKVVFASFLNHPDIHGFASTSTLGICNIFSYQ